jgi:2-C-methyl-D-erythritol 4-phosphate cytidylyltransferase
VVVPAPRDNLKVTTALDLDLAELLLARRHG